MEFITIMWGLVSSKEWKWHEEIILKPKGVTLKEKTPMFLSENS